VVYVNRLKDRRREAFESLMVTSSEADKSLKADLAAEVGQDSDNDSQAESVWDTVRESSRGSADSQMLWAE
jgi:hypothetical protein